MHLSLTGEPTWHHRGKSNRTDPCHWTWYSQGHGERSYSGVHRLAAQYAANRYYPPQTPERKNKAMHLLKAQQCRNRRCSGQL